MVGSIEQIEQEIGELDRAVIALAEELHNAYSNYLRGLGGAVRQQLILASYHICTQGYPEQFLQLPYTQRQELQQALRQLAQQVQEELLAQLHKPAPIQEPAEDWQEEKDDHPEAWDNQKEMDAVDSILCAQTSDGAGLDSVEPDSHAILRALTPADLVEWQEEVEQSILQELRMASHAANRLLQQFGILSKKLPEPVLESAAKAEMAEVGGSPPNLLNLLVETVEQNVDHPRQLPSRELKGSPMLHILAIHLRLAEIEFADASLNPARTRIRSLVNRLKALGRKYEKKHQEHAIAQAQAAWRATWTEE